jgi:hypothetical protein
MDIWVRTMAAYKMKAAQAGLKSNMMKTSLKNVLLQHLSRAEFEPRAFRPIKPDPVLLYCNLQYDCSIKSSKKILKKKK